MKEMKLMPSGDSALTIQLGSEISEPVHQRVAAMAGLLEQAGIPGVLELIPTYCSLMVCYDPLTLSYEQLVSRIGELAGQGENSAPKTRTVVEIPVCYGGSYGPDLPFVAEHCRMTQEQVIALHAEPEYLIYMLGFTPGFPYLGGMDPRLATPRLAEPRVKIAGGSVGIAGEQTGLYPMDSPGGWQLIGRTPLRLYDPEREEPILLKASQYLKFRPISEEEFLSIQAQVEQGRYEPLVRTVEV